MAGAQPEREPAGVMLAPRRCGVAPRGERPAWGGRRGHPVLNGHAHESDPARWYSTNLVGVPAPVLASAAFNAHPLPLRIAGAREANAGLFALLERSSDADEARAMFAHYMSIAFAWPGLPRRRPICRYGGIPTLARELPPAAARLGARCERARRAVLKGWVESRFGLVPSFHKAPLARFPSPAWWLSRREGVQPLSQQLHLSAARPAVRVLPVAAGPLPGAGDSGEGTHVSLWRGSTRCEEQLVEGTLRERRCTVRLNNLVSFSRSREEAECFGDWVLRARVPASSCCLCRACSTRAPARRGRGAGPRGDYEWRRTMHVDAPSWRPSSLPGRATDLSALLDRALGAYLGLAIGDALGATVEFMTPREIAERFAAQGGVHRHIVGGAGSSSRRGRSPTTRP